MAAIAAGVRQLPEETDVVVVLAADLPFVTPAHLDRLVSAATADQPGAGAVTVDADGRRNWLCSAWPRAPLAAALDRIGDPSGRSMRDLAAGLRPREVADLHGVADDVDTPSDLEQARRRDGAEGSPT